MSYYYDDELPAGFQDADIEQAMWEDAGRAVNAYRRANGCACQSVVGVGSDGKAHYPEAEGLTPGQVRCTEGCGRVFASDEDWTDFLSGF